MSVPGPISSPDVCVGPDGDDPSLRYRDRGHPAPGGVHRVDAAVHEREVRGSVRIHRGPLPVGAPDTERAEHSERPRGYASPTTTPGYRASAASRVIVRPARRARAARRPRARARHRASSGPCAAKGPARIRRHGSPAPSNPTNPRAPPPPPSATADPGCWSARRAAGGSAAPPRAARARAWSSPRRRACRRPGTKRGR